MTMLKTEVRFPPIWEARLPQKFSAATTWMIPLVVGVACSGEGPVEPEGLEAAEPGLHDRPAAPLLVDAGVGIEEQGFGAVLANTA
ncbi:MAG TPA: hypothetical protein VGS23_02495 [Thermoplasmata archaeon]|nr:hypothetical protein [Thermoplasmata archaeon]